MSNSELWKETREVVLACKASPLFPKKRKEVKEFIRYVKKVVEENFLDQAA